MDPSDKDLLARVRAGDGDSGRVLLRRHGRAVLRFFRAKLPDVAEDLTQEVFARLLQSSESVEAVRPWLFGAARNVLREELRRRSHRFDALSSIADLRAESSTALLRKHRLLAALQALPLDDQIIIEMSYWEGFNSADQAAILGVSPSAARSRLAKARERVRTSLDKAFPRRARTPGVDDLEAWASELRGLLESRAR